MPPLREIQRAFAASLLRGDDAQVAGYVVEDGFTTTERLRIYRNSSRSTITEALRLTYPAVNRLVGSDFFDAAAEGFIMKSPPGSGCLTDYGGDFAAFLATFLSAAALRYLPDVARFEWALNLAAYAEDASTLDLAELARVAPEQHDQLRFAPHPSVRLLALEHPADAIADAVLADDDEAIRALDPMSGPVRLVVNRGRDGVDARRLTPAEYSFAARLFAGEQLGEIAESHGTDAASPLADHLANGRLSGFWVGADAESKQTVE